MYCKDTQIFDLTWEIYFDLLAGEPLYHKYIFLWSITGKHALQNMLQISFSSLTTFTLENGKIN